MLLAQCERITNQGCWAATDRTVIDNMTFSTKATCTRTRINALLVRASLISWTIGADGTLRAASSCGWCAMETGQAFTNGIFSRSLADGVDATRRWIARVDRNAFLKKKISLVIILCKINRRSYPKKSFQCYL